MIGNADMARWWHRPPFAAHVAHVVLLCADEEVLRIDASRGVAAMKDMLRALEHDAVKELISQPVRPDQPFAATTAPQHAITTSIL